MKATYITWFDATYGLGFLKNTLAAFYRGDIKTRRGPKIKKDKADQRSLEKTFDPKPEEGQTNKFPFDRVYVLHVEQTVMNHLTSPRRKSANLFRPSEIERGFTTEALEHKWEEVYRQELSLQKELVFI